MVKVVNEFFSYFWPTLVAGGVTVILFIPFVFLATWLMDRLKHSALSLFLVILLAIVYAATLVAALYTLTS